MKIPDPLLSELVFTVLALEINGVLCLRMLDPYKVHVQWAAYCPCFSMDLQ